MYKFIAIVYCLIIFVALPSHAGSGNYYLTQVGLLKSGSDVYGIAQIEGNLASVPACAENYKYQITFLVNDDFGKLLYTNALTAVTSKSQVWMKWSDTNCGYAGDRPLTTRIDVKNGQ